jgi:transcriptional regulator with XRE-family HTH domain
VPRDERIERVLENVGPRLRELRVKREVTLKGLSERTGVSISTLSRLESGQRRPTLELLLALAEAYQVPITELVDAPRVGDPRIHAEPFVMGDLVAVPLTREQTGVRAFKLVIPADRKDPTPKTHQGYEWMYVLSGRLRVVVGDLDMIMRAGEAAEFDTRVPHWFGSAGDGPVEVLTLFGPQGERMHLRARPQNSGPTE